MKIAYPMRIDVLDKPGGDLLQVQHYIEVGEKLCTKSLSGFKGNILHNFNDDLCAYDVVHLTNIDRPIDTYKQFLAATYAHKPIIVSPIHHSYKEVERFEKAGRDGIIGLVSGSLDFCQVEYLRSIIRSKKYIELVRPTIHMAINGMRTSQRAILMGARKILILTDKEKNDILSDFGKIPEEKFVKLRNGFELSIDKQHDVSMRKFDVCVVGRIEAGKNQIAILQVLDLMGICGIFIGCENPNHKHYCQRFKEMITQSRSKYVGALSHENTLNIMRQSRLHVSASWFEVLSLVDLEAYVCGCGVISSQCGGTKEILGDYAEYVDPASEQSIQNGIKNMLEKQLEKNANIDKSLKIDTWDEVGSKLLEIYQNCVMHEPFYKLTKGYLI
jgi:glycosyltransferase involved in cell wall biosynthesis